MAAHARVQLVDLLLAGGLNRNQRDPVATMAFYSPETVRIASPLVQISILKTGYPQKGLARVTCGVPWPWHQVMEACHGLCYKKTYMYIGEISEQLA